MEFHVVDAAKAADSILFGWKKRMQRVNKENGFWKKYCYLVHPLKKYSRLSASLADIADTDGKFGFEPISGKFVSSNRGCGASIGFSVVVSGNH